MKRFGFVSFVLLLLLLSTACNQQRPAGTNITVEGAATGTLYYQVGDGKWRRMPRIDDLRFGFVLPAEETRYGVALLCNPPWFSTDAQLWVYQLTAEDATELRLDCGPSASDSLSAVTLVIHKNPNDTAGYTSARASLGAGYGSAQLDQPLGLYARPQPGQGLLVWARDANAPYPIVRLRYDPGFDARPGHCPHDQPCTVELGSGDAVQHQSVAPVSAPPWANRGGFSVKFLAHGWTYTAFTNLGGLSGGPYTVVPGAVEGDVYLARAGARDGTGTYRVGEFRTLGPQAEPIEFELPQDKFDPSCSEEALPTFGNLNYPHAPAAYLFHLSVGARHALLYRFHESILVSPRWLGTADAYTVPDLSGAPGLAGTRPLTGDGVVWTAGAMLSDRSLGELLNAERTPEYSFLSEYARFREPGLRLRFASKSGQYVVP